MEITEKYIDIRKIDFEKSPYGQYRIICPLGCKTIVEKIKIDDDWALVCYYSHNGKKSTIGNICDHLEDYFCGKERGDFWWNDRNLL